MPKHYESMMSQLKVAEIKKAVDNYEPVGLVERHDLRVNGGTPDVQEFIEWAELTTSPVISVSVIEFVGTVADANLTNLEFLGGSALTNGIDISVRKNGVTMSIALIKTNLDLFDFFDEVTITTDTEATPNHTLKARKLYADQDGMFLQLVDKTTSDEDGIIFTVSDDLSSVGVAISGNVHGYGYVGRR